MSRVAGPIRVCYKDIQTTRDNHTSANGPPPAGLQYADATEEMFLHFGGVAGVTGRGKWTPFPHQWQMDLDDTAFRQAFAANVVNDLTVHGWDGCWFDNVDYFEPYAVTSAGCNGGLSFTYAAHPELWPVGWQTQPEVAIRTINFLAYVQRRIQRAGFLIFGNSLGNTRLYYTTSPPNDPVAQIAPYLDGMYSEYFGRLDVTVGTGYQLPNFNPLHDITRQFNEIITCNALGLQSQVVIQTTGAHTDAVAKLFGAVIYYLVNEGLTTASFGNDGGISLDNYNLGAPLASMTNPANQTWFRQYANGMVGANLGNDNTGNVLTGIPEASLSLGGRTFVHPTLGNVTSCPWAVGESLVLPLAA